jgi:hypothetical protein
VDDAGHDSPKAAKVNGARTGVRIYPEDSEMNDDMGPSHEAEPGGITLDDLPEIMRELFDRCVADAQSVADPEQDFDAFVNALWDQVAAAFSLVRRDWPDAAPTPWPAQMEQQRGVAEALLEGRLQPGDLAG